MKIMFDECFGKRAARILTEILSLHKPAIEAHFLIDFLGQNGVKDDVWIPQLANAHDAQWIVITADQGRRSGGPPLPLLLPKFGITSVYLSGKIHTSSGFDKVHATVSVWPDILADTENVPMGTRFKIVRRNMNGRQRISYRLWPLPADKSMIKS